MPRTSLRIYLLAAACLVNTCFALADERSSKPARMKPPTITLRDVAPADSAKQLLVLTLEVANPNDASLSYTGYAPNSFDPPLAAGHIAPLCQIDLKRDGKWQPGPKADCGFGLADLELTARGSATFAVGVPADDWQAVKVGIGHFPGWSNEETATTTIWSTEITREAIRAAVDKPVSQTVPESGLPVGKWTVEFADGSVEACEICVDGTASVSEPQRSSTGKAKMQDGGLLLVFNDDRTERWTAIGKRFVVEHWFPASQFPSVAPVLGIAERRD